MSADPPPAPAPGYVYLRHTVPVRVMHWVNVIALTTLFMSGLQIFNAHPTLYWGHSSYSGKPPLLQIGARDGAGDKRKGVTTVLGAQFETTGVLGVSILPNGTPYERAFPPWATIPSWYSLALARDWHLFFAWVFVINGVVYVLYSLFSRHLLRDLTPTGADLRGIGASIKQHLKLKHPTGEAARRYNVLQKLAYLSVIFVLLPLIVVAGWAMSPWLASLIPGWVDWLGGRQSARTIHFIVAWLLIAFVAVHVFEVIISGFWNHLRSMITGYYRVIVDKAETRT